MFSKKQLGGRRCHLHSGKTMDRASLGFCQNNLEKGELNRNRLKLHDSNYVTFQRHTTTGTVNRSVVAMGWQEKG
jgi:hypothetical protein